MALENVITTLVLDVIDHDQTHGVVKAIALDSKTRYVQAAIVQHGLDYDVDPNAVVTLTIIRPDNVGVQVTGSVVDVDNSERTATIKGVYAELTQAALAKSGTLRAQFKMTVGQQILRTEIFQIKNGIALDGETSEWADQYEGYNLDELVQNVNSAVATVEGMEQYVSELKSGFNDLYNTAYVTDSASGGVAHFVDGADDVPLKSLKVAIEPVQSGSGDPSPDNVRPISGRDSIGVNVTVKNLLDFEWLLKKWGANYTKTDDAFIVTTLGQGYYHPYVFAQKDVNISVSAVIINGEGASLWRLDFLNANNKVVASLNADNSSVTNVMASKIRLNYITAGSGATYRNVQVELGSEVTEFEPYKGKTYDISLASAGTVYGGTLDVVNGKLVVDKAYTTLQDYPTWNGLYITNNVKRLVSGAYLKDTTATMCDTLQAFQNQSGISDGALNTISITTDGRIVITPSFIQSAATADEAKEILMAADPIHLVYTLAAPITYNLTPTEVKSFLGINNIWADAGDVTAEYRADTKLYIKRLTDSDTDMVADSNITSGKYFMVGNDLYRATVNIASGAQIVVGTNATKVSLSEALNQIKEA